MIMAGGSGTRLWPMSRTALPKQLIPFIHGKSLLQIAVDRLSGLVREESIHICAGQTHQQAITESVTGVGGFYGEPIGRDTLNAVGLVAAEIAARDPDAVIAVFTADHLIEPVDEFQTIVNRGFAVAEAQPNALVTFGVAPTTAATGYGYLQLGSSVGDAHIVEQFKEKPDATAAEQYLAAGPEKYLWNSGMFVWRAATLMQCIKKYVPDNFAGLDELGRLWLTEQRDEALNRIYPQLPKISVDYAIMEPASKDDAFQVMAVPMPLTWLDVGSWPAFAQTCEQDNNNNAIAATKHLLLDSAGNLIASNDPDHLITTIGVDNLIIIHTPDATLVCRADRAEDIKQLYEQVGEEYR
jgi:mannose-1-phosphate guanylyltransferase